MNDASRLPSLPKEEAELAALAAALFPEGAGSIEQLTWNGVENVTPSRTHDDLDDRERAEAKVRAAELRYRTLVEQIPAVTFMAVLGEGDNEIYVSPHIEALLGFTQAEWLENPFLWYSQLHPDDREIWHAEFARGIRTGGPFRAECRFLARDGRVVWVRGEARLIKDEVGRPLFLQGVAFDITESKRAEAAALEEAIRGTQQRYRDLVEHLEAIFWEVEAETSRFTFVSEGAERILGFPSARWTADPRFWLDRIHPDDRAMVEQVWSSPLAGDDREFEFRALAADGRQVWLQTRIRRPLTVAGREYLLGVMLDVTERKANEAQLRRLHREAEEAREIAEKANRAKDEFLATVSHELRTPLNALIGYTQLLRNDQMPQDMIHRALERIEISAQTQSRLVEDLLDVSRIITGKLRLDVAPVELATCVDAAVESVRLSASAKHITLVESIDRSGVVVSGDAARLQQVVWNFLSNAVKYTPSGGRIEIVLEHAGGLARVRVTDSGEGIDPAFLPSVFERFRQADSSITRKHGGLGLGLAIVRHLVEAHGGRAWAESRGIGQGATFVAELPLAAIHEQAQSPESSERRHGTHRRATLNGLRILVVDDDEDARALLHAALSAAGAAVTTASGPREAIEQLSIVRPHVLLSDIGMAGQDGFQLLRKIRETEGHERLPAIAVTAYVDGTSRQKVSDAGFEGYLPKPIHVDALVRLVEQVAKNLPEPPRRANRRGNGQKPRNRR